MVSGDEPRHRNDYGLPMQCPKCAYRWLKLPGLKMRPCPNDGSELFSTRPRKPRKQHAVEDNGPN